jgi:hypothetical protein
VSKRLNWCQKVSQILPGGAGAVIGDPDHILDGLDNHGACKGEDTSEQEVASIC